MDGHTVLSFWQLPSGQTKPVVHDTGVGQSNLLLTQRPSWQRILPLGQEAGMKQSAGFRTQEIPSGHGTRPGTQTCDVGHPVVALRYKPEQTSADQPGLRSASVKAPQAEALAQY